jgi:hypothetical protein
LATAQFCEAGDRDGHLGRSGWADLAHGHAVMRVVRHYRTTRQRDFEKWVCGRSSFASSRKRSTFSL